MVRKKERYSPSSTILMIVVLLSMLLLSGCKVKKSMSAVQTATAYAERNSYVNEDALHAINSNHKAHLAEAYSDNIGSMMDIMTDVTTTYERYTPPDPAGKQHLVDKATYSSIHTDKSRTHRDILYSKSLDSIIAIADSLRHINQYKDRLIADQRITSITKDKSSSDSRPNYLLYLIILVLSAIVLYQNRYGFLRLIKMFLG